MRANILADKAVEIWKSPHIAEDILEIYRSDGKTVSEYSIKDHPNLKGGIALKLFDAMRLEVLALDACVREEFHKLYVAYKAETNFVDVVPRLRVYF